jgi:hypothetical protein
MKSTAAQPHLRSTLDSARRLCRSAKSIDARRPAMRIAWIGGMTRNNEAYETEAWKRGHVLETHSGHVGGRGSESLRAMIARSDLVVALTEINSHGAVEIARRTARELDKPFVLLRRCGIARFRALLDAYDRRSAFIARSA